MASTLPDNPSLEHLRREARALQRERSAGSAPMALHEAQRTVARRYGFTGWPALVRYLDVAAALSVDPDRVDEAALSAADRFCSLSVLRYSDSDAPPRWAAASEILAAEPGLVDSHIWAAAAAADPEALARHLARGDDANSHGGPFGWPALLYLCYARSPAGSNDEITSAATLLLDAGADPDAGYLWRGMSTPFTALTGVFGEGEQGPRRQPRHRAAAHLASLLLARGAHPVDQQTLYNRMFRDDDSHLELLFAHGLADAAPGPWERRLGEAMETREQMWQRQITWAADHGFRRRLDLLARHGIDTSGARMTEPRIPDDPNTLDDDGATPLHHAAWDGDLDLIRRLLASGADPTIVDTRFDATPQGWAEHAYQTEAADLLRSATRP
ncbi:ankyrin repeat domain-containing protein [Mycobacterium sp. 236(2023)]|uniref:ankyrin repeat domain-containing protein n=1 Tax=Mycobacterium sp. 236(2023) TaxID=3038163 RepID=UPI002414E38D|nr:ankyrin repeat domain-containing protein [Mycobacterium sp. 236(2023)]MDG4666651.1 ankyrin repeat domain-containing protein [Mycobacterium sp. 236(2023)]